MSKTKEQKARDNFDKYAMGRIHLEPIENQRSSATPDCLGINREGGVFWLEFKAIDEWPKREATAPLRGKFEKGQIPFLKQWKSWRGNAFVVLRAEDEFYLLDPKYAAVDLESATKQELINDAHHIGIKNIINLLEKLR